MSARVLHVTPCLSRGGAGRALLGAAELAAAADGSEHRVASLTPALAGAEGLELLDAPSPARLREALAVADIVQLHFWNTPELYELLEARLPAMRLLVWSAVGGERPPQVLLPELVGLADRTVSQTALGDVEVIAPAHAGGLEREIPRVAHAGFAVGYVGTVDPVKLHPGFMDMSARVDVPGIRFVVCGGGDGFGAIDARARELGVAERFDLRGWTDDVPGVLAALDVFGYPLCEDNYSAGELVLQEAMAAGVPPVVLPYGGAARMVRDGETGLVAADPAEYTRAIERLHGDPALRRRLGRAAREHALKEWDPAGLGRRWASVYGELMAAPKRERAPLWSGEPEAAYPGAARFVRGLGGRAPQFAESVAAARAGEPSGREDEIAASSAALAGAATGGVLHYRRHHPRDALLRLWAGLVLAGQGRRALAAGELASALRLGLPRPLVAPHLQDVGAQLGHPHLDRLPLAGVPGER